MNEAYLKKRLSPPLHPLSQKNFPEGGSRRQGDVFYFKTKKLFFEEKIDKRKKARFTKKPRLCPLFGSSLSKSASALATRKRCRTKCAKDLETFFQKS